MGQLLAIHPGLLVEAKKLVRDRLASEDADTGAEDLEWALRSVDCSPLASRAGRVDRRGYAHENEGAGELLARALDPYLTYLARRAALGLNEAA